MNPIQRQYEPLITAISPGELQLPLINSKIKGLKRRLFERRNKQISNFILGQNENDSSIIKDYSQHQWNIQEVKDIDQALLADQNVAYKIVNEGQVADIIRWTLGAQDIHHAQRFPSKIR
ncbi:MAG: hypothetical protein EZS28_009904 [Streblomastix strix]|uniref:Uncharacterized protein n=1 Tax=Streblomastix strix TaxID=222440 RepID=A0A5J4WIM1_9EUKA|nr:MAG: hypothetical protein EZS28_009904 [Streblomastix strix]